MANSEIAYAIFNFVRSYQRIDEEPKYEPVHSAQECLDYIDRALEVEPNDKPQAEARKAAEELPGDDEEESIEPAIDLARMEGRV